ncbi:MAG: hypothetical protein HUU15_04745, partial [Candidatus Brocadiae bacterium]|nr:hypothetical protein [Candidatus Brocadiia bacterium]
MPVEPLSLTLMRAEAVQQIQSLIGQAERSALAASGRLSVESARTADASVAAAQEAVEAHIHGGGDGEGA